MVPAEPMMTVPSESPTRRISMPARSRIRAMVASYAVRVVIFSRRFFLRIKSGIRTRVEGWGTGVPSMVERARQPPPTRSAALHLEQPDTGVGGGEVEQGPARADVAFHAVFPEFALHANLEIRRHRS